MGHTQDHTVVQGREILANVLACLKRADFEEKCLTSHTGKSDSDPKYQLHLWQKT